SADALGATSRRPALVRRKRDQATSASGGPNVRVTATMFRASPSSRAKRSGCSQSQKSNTKYTPSTLQLNSAAKARRSGVANGANVTNQSKYHGWNQNVANSSSSTSASKAERASDSNEPSVFHSRQASPMAKQAMPIAWTSWRAVASLSGPCKR